MGIDDKQKHVKCNKNRRARYTFCCISLNNDFNKIYLQHLAKLFRNCCHLLRFISWQFRNRQRKVKLFNRYNMRKLWKQDGNDFPINLVFPFPRKTHWINEILSLVEIPFLAFGDSIFDIIKMQRKEFGLSYNEKAKHVQTEKQNHKSTFCFR